MVGKIPLYIQLYNRLRIDIEEGVYSPSERMPSEAELEAKYNTSRITIRKAISLLANEGYVSVRQGLGTIVASPMMYNINCVTSLTEQLRAAGYKPSARDIHISRQSAPAEIVNAMGISPNTEMVCVQRIQLADDQPVGIISNYILPEVVPDIENKDHNFISLYQFLEEEYNIRIDTSRDIISARTADLAQATTLKIPVGSPLIYIIRISFADGAPILGDVVYINGYMHHFSFIRSGRSPRMNMTESVSNRSNISSVNQCISSTEK